MCRIPMHIFLYLNDLFVHIYIYALCLVVHPAARSGPSATSDQFGFLPTVRKRFGTPRDVIWCRTNKVDWLTADIKSSRFC